MILVEMNETKIGLTYCYR